jgi:hypothetical protein
MSTTHNKVQDELKNFLTDENEFVSSAAKRVIDLASLLDAGEISEDEFNELAGDVVDIQKVADAAADVKRAAQIETGIRAIAALLPKIVGLVAGK